MSITSDQMHKTHQPRTMYDPNNGTLDLYWDANGNLAQMIGCKQNSGRLHEWDVKRNSRTEKSPVDSSRSKCGARVCQSKHRTQFDRLRFVLGDKHAGYYGYDATVTAYFAPCAEEALEAVYETSTAIKILRDGQVFIFRDDKTYTVIGQEVK